MIFISEYFSQATMDLLNWLIKMLKIIVGW